MSKKTTNPGSGLHFRNGEEILPFKKILKEKRIVFLKISCRYKKSKRSPREMIFRDPEGLKLNIIEGTNMVSLDVQKDLVVLDEFSNFKNLSKEKTFRIRDFSFSYNLLFPTKDLKSLVWK